MIVKIHGEGKKVSEGLKQLIARKTHFSLDRFERKISRLSISLQDVNGPRGGIDQVCRIVLHWSEGGAPVVVSATHDHAFGAVELAFGKLNRTVSRRLQRRRRVERRPLCHVGPPEQGLPLI